VECARAHVIAVRAPASMVGEASRSARDEPEQR